MAFKDWLSKSEFSSNPPMTVATVATHVDYDGAVSEVIFEFDEKLSTNYTMKEIPTGFTRHTLALEAAYTRAANIGDTKLFMELLSEWRGAWLSLFVKSKTRH